MKRYSEEETRLISASKYSDRELSQILNRTEDAIAAKRQRMKIINRKVKTWSKEEEQFLSEHYKKMQDKELAKILGRPPNSILLKRLQLKLYKKKEFEKNEK